MFFFLDFKVMLGRESFFEIFIFDGLGSDLLSQGVDAFLVLFVELCNLLVEEFLILGGLQLWSLRRIFVFIFLQGLNFLIFSCEFFHEFFNDVVMLSERDHLSLKWIMQLLQTKQLWMISLIKICFAFFVFFLLLFFQVEFAVNPHLPGSSSLKLLPVPANPGFFPKQVVLVIIDALRSDYKDKFDFISNLMAKYPSSTYLAKSKVGNPTMTTQRIESMMTGSEIFSSGNILKTFLASRVDYDNLVSQLNHNNKSASIFGDNTWVKLFDFSHSEVCVNTFDVHDLDTCDQVVYEHLPKETFTAGQSNHSSSFIVSHILGVDHVGHSRSSIDVPILDVKIKEISAFLERLFDAADDGVMFLITGDHGMRSDGNHGGTTKEEVQTLIFGYFKGAALYQQNKRPVVAHCDMTSTLSILLDIPLPKNAIGYPILNLLPASLTTNDDINSINNNLYTHFSSMLSFYSLPLSVEQSLNYTSKLLQPNQEQQILIEYLNQRLTFLKYSSPEPTTVMAIASILSLLVLSILFYSFWNQLVVGFTQCRGKLFLMVFCEGLPMFTLFISYFSWNIIQNLSDALVSGFLTALIFGVLFNQALRNKVEVLLKILIPFVVLSQIEPDKSNDYKPSSLRLTSLNALLSTKTFWLAISSAEIIFYLKIAVKEYHSLSGENNSRRQHLGFVKMIIAVLSYLNYIFSNLLKSPIYEVSIIQTITLIGYTVILCLGEMSSEERSLGDNLKFIVINFLSVFMGPHFPLILAVCMYIQRQVATCYNYAILMSLLSKCVWWWLGNRYEYSGVDILKTYVYSSSYAIFLNGLTLVIYLNSPFILNFVLLNYRLLSLQPRIERCLDETDTSQYHWEIAGEGDRSEFSSVGENQSISSVFLGYLQTSNLKYAGVLMLGLVSSIWTTLFNNEKILFTVVCVPVLVLIALITLSTLLMTLGLLAYFGRKVKSEYHQLELET